MSYVVGFVMVKFSAPCLLTTICTHCDYIALLKLNMKREKEYRGKMSKKYIGTTNVQKK